jgi:hypothetical protein
MGQMLGRLNMSPKKDLHQDDMLKIIFDIQHQIPILQIAKKYRITTQTVIEIKDNYDKQKPFIEKKKLKINRTPKIKIINPESGQPCKKCDKGAMVLRQSKRGNEFLGCSKYPDCDNKLPYYIPDA